MARSEFVPFKSGALLSFVLPKTPTKLLNLIYSQHFLSSFHVTSSILQEILQEVIRPLFLHRYSLQVDAYPPILRNSQLIALLYFLFPMPYSSLSQCIPYFLLICVNFMSSWFHLINIRILKTLSFKGILFFPSVPSIVSIAV